MSFRHRSPASAYLLFNPNTTLGWSVARRISFERGEQMVAWGTVVQVNDEFGRHIGYKFRDASEPKTPLIKVSGSTAPTIRAKESMANAGLMGGSRTARLSDEQRLSRIHPLSGKLLAPEDMVERAREKVRIYPEVSDRKAPCVAPRA